MALAIIALDGHGPSNEICCQLQPKETKVNTELTIYIIAQANSTTYHTLLARWNTLVFKVGMSYGWQTINIVSSELPVTTKEFKVVLY